MAPKPNLLACPVCGSQFAQLDRHHIVMQAYQSLAFAKGIKNDQMIGLCASCHQGIHRQAKRIFAGTIAPDLLTPEQLTRAKPLIDVLVWCYTEARERGVDPEQRRTVSLRLAQRQIEALYAAKTAAGCDSLSDLVIAVFNLPRDD